MVRNLTQLFSPGSIAVIGASQSPEKVGAVVLKNILNSGFKGQIYPVNPHLADINHLKCYPDVRSLPEIPDLAVIAIPAAIVVSIIKDIREKGIKNIVILSSGFKEVGKPGEELEKQIIGLARNYRLNILGPNCMGFANNQLPLNVTFGQVIKKLGNLRIISQSGALASGLFDWFQASRLGFSQFITIGNKAVVNENDILHFFLNQPPSSVIAPLGLYLESIGDGQEFISLASKISQNHPVFILKPGKSAAAVRAMRSHTGSIAGEDSVLEIALKEAGIIRCHQLGDFFDLARTLAWKKIPSGPKVAVISNAGGPAVLTTDTISNTGLELSKLSRNTRKKLADCLPSIAGLNNPVDVLGDALALRITQVLEIVLQDKSVDSVIVILTPQLMTEISKTAESIGKLAKIYPQPVLCSFIGGRSVTSGEKILNRYRVPSFPFPERAVHTLAAIWHWQQWRQSQKQSISTQPSLPASKLRKAKTILAGVQKNHRQILDNFEANDLIQSIDISTPPSLFVSDLHQADNFAAKHWPVVLKLSSSALLHKSDLGGVITHIENSQQLKIAWLNLQQKISLLNKKIIEPVNIQIQKQIIDGIEIILGVKHDPTFGPVMLFGAGGQLAELLNDRNLRLLPLDESAARQLVTESKINRILSGYRGNKPYSLIPLYHAMISLSKLAQSFPEISEIEINPLLITYSGLWAVDTKVIYQSFDSKVY